MYKPNQERLRRLDVRREAEEAIRQLGQIDQSAETGTYLVSDFRPRDDLPVTASLRKMSAAVAKRLAEMGLREPVSLQAVPNRWWSVNIDAAEVGLSSEYGNAFVTRILSTVQLMRQGFEVVEGPFSAWETKEVSRAILSRYPGQFWDSRIVQVTARPGGEGQPYFSGMDDAHTSEALIDGLDRGDGIQVFSGPYETEDAAGYALDIRWESLD